MPDLEPIVIDELLVPLLEAASPELFRNNAFRVLGLSVHATDRDIKKHAEKIQMMERLGNSGKLPSTGPMAIEPPPMADMISDAMQRIRDPETRLTDEFFWFWPEDNSHSDSRDEALAALAARNVEGALKMWGQRVGNDDDAGGVALHNLAVLNLVCALDLQLVSQTGGISAQQQEEQSNYWRTGLWRLGQTLSSERVYSQLISRIRALADPRLTEETVRRLLATTPLALLLINAQLAVRAAQREDIPEVNRQLRIMENSGWSAELIEEAMRRAVQPLREHILRLCTIARDEADETLGAQVATHLLEQSKPFLTALDTLLPSGGPLRDDVRDEVALVALHLGIGYGNKTNKWAEAQDLMDRARTYAISPSVRQRITENLETAKTNIELGVHGHCWFCGDNDGEAGHEIEVPMYGDVVRIPVYNGTQVTWRNLQVSVPRCGRCVEVHQRHAKFRGRGSWWAFLAWAITYGLMLLIISGLEATVGCETLVLAVIGLIVIRWVGRDIGHQLAVVSSPQGIMPDSHKSQFPYVQKMISAGWSIGKGPT
jgi:hypothetical protein